MWVNVVQEKTKEKQLFVELRALRKAINPCTWLAVIIGQILGLEMIQRYMEKLILVQLQATLSVKGFRQDKSVKVILNEAEKFEL